MLSRRDTVKHLAEAIATDLFISMLNPKMRGSGFDYHSFDIGRHIDAMIGINVSWELTSAQRKYAVECARAIWSRWIKQAGAGLPAAANREHRTDQAGSFNGMTHAEIAVACRNFDIDLACGACAAIFYTGVSFADDVHDETCCTNKSS